MDFSNQSRRQALVVCLLLVSVILVSYWQVQFADFVGFDDERYVTKNRDVQAGLTWQGVVWAFTTLHEANWHPLTWLSHMFDCELYGMNPMGHHWTSLLFHMANSLLLFYIFQQMTGAAWPSAFVAALFALHPLHVESVAWVSQRRDVLSTFFGFLSIALYFRYVKKRTLVSYLLSMLLLSLGLMAKPMLVTLPFVFILLDFWPLKRFHGEGDTLSQAGRRTGIEGRQVGWLVLEKTPFLVLISFSCITTFMAQRSGGAVISLKHFSLPVRISNALVAYIRYIVKAVWPNHLSVYYPHPGETLAAWQVFGAALLIIGMSVLAMRLLNRYPYVAVGWFWFLGTLIPVIGIVQVGLQAMADRYTYVPLTGLFVIIAWGISDLTSKWSYRTILLFVSACIVLFLLIVRTMIQVDHWKNAVTLFENAIKIDYNNSLAQNNLATALSLQGKIDKAVFHYREAMRIDPNSVLIRNNLAAMLFSQGKFEEAARHYREILKVDPENFMAHYNFGVIFLKNNNIQAAYVHFAEAIRIHSDFAEAYDYIGLILAHQGKFKEAEIFFSRAIQIAPDFVKARKHFENNSKKLLEKRMPKDR